MLQALNKNRHTVILGIKLIKPLLRPGLNPRTWVPEASMLTTRPAFFKLWSSGSARVVLGLTFYEINYPAYIDVLL
jgi:hypothetical protein